MTEIHASDELVELAFAALDHGIESVRDGGGPLVPFTLSEGPDGRQLTRFAAELLEEGQEEARRHVREAAGAERVALAVDGYLSVEGERSDAILVEAQERGMTTCLVFAQRYKPAGRLSAFESVGNAGFVGPGSSLLD
jgi:hypothetical protein